MLKILVGLEAGANRGRDLQARDDLQQLQGLRGRQHLRRAANASVLKLLHPCATSAALVCPWPAVCDMRYQSCRGSLECRFGGVYFKRTSRSRGNAGALFTLHAAPY